MVWKDFDDATYDQRRQPDFWHRRKTWGQLYRYSLEWQRLIAGTITRYQWLKSRGRL